MTGYKDWPALRVEIYGVIQGEFSFLVFLKTKNKKINCVFSFTQVNALLRDTRSGNAFLPKPLDPLARTLTDILLSITFVLI